MGRLIHLTASKSTSDRAGISDYRIQFMMIRSLAISIFCLRVWELNSTRIWVAGFDNSVE